MKKPSTAINRTIFIVEDDIELSAVIDRILLSINSSLKFEWVTSAEEAIKILEKKANSKMGNPYDLVICDIFLDGARTGIDLWKYCQTRFPKMKILITSGIEYDELISLLNTKDATPLFLKKPFSVATCSNLLEKLLIEN
jgi:DNA-binding NtrC family response regulator